MSLPDYRTLMRPLLELHGDGAELDRPTVWALLAEQFRLTPEELVEVLPSGRQRKFDNRTAWATTYLVQAGLLERPRRGVTKITGRGLEILRQHPQRIDISVLAQFEEFRRFRQGQPTTAGDGSGAQKPEPAVAAETPEEALGLGHATKRERITSPKENR